ncbi:MAG: type secretion system protein VirB2 [Betaproteobacteria bacterium]|nr:type secretion system protein VirB2 [Betaproteobacteria bacterium]
MRFSRLELQTIATMGLAFSLLALAPDVMANTGSAKFADACKKVSGFFANFETILRVASVSIVTIAVVFAGYQIAFAHKRLSDVAPVLVGGLLIGGAATIAGWFVGDWQAATHVGVANTC